MTLPSQSAGIHLGVFQGFIVTTDEDGMVPLNSRVLATIEPGATQFWIDLLAENSKLKGQLEEAVAALEMLNDDGCYGDCAHYGLAEGKHSAICTTFSSLISKLKEAGS